MTPWQAAILGFVEGLTEYLPVSSTGHLIIASALMGLSDSPDSKRNIDAFTIVIQGGAILAVLILYWKRITQIFRGIIGRDPYGTRLAANLAIAFVPAAILGVLLKDPIERLLFYPAPVMAALALGGIIMIVIGRWQGQFFRGDEHDEPHDPHDFVDIEHLTWRRALIIGLLQCVALWPGTSRSMMTIVGGMMVGLRPRQAAEFSFLLGLPTLGGACIYTALKNFSGQGPDMIQTIGLTQIIIGVAVATISAAFAVRWLVAFLGRHGLAVFGWYRLALCAVLALLVWKGTITIAPQSETPGAGGPTPAATASD